MYSMLHTDCVICGEASSDLTLGGGGGEAFPSLILVPVHKAPKTNHFLRYIWSEYLVWLYSNLIWT